VELYFAYPSPYCQKVLIALAEKKLEFVAKHVDLADPQDCASYRVIYPIGKVPLLVTGDNMLVPESGIIVEYLDELTSAARMVPEAADQARTVRLWDRLIDQNLTAPVLNLLFESMKPEGKRDQGQIDRWSRSVGTMYRMMEDQLSRMPYLGGMSFSLADCSAMPALHYAHQFASLNGFEKLSGYYETLMLRASVMRVFDEAAPYVKKMLG
jgi:glutathione S-transferase